MKTFNQPRYPVTRQGTPADYDNYPLLCEAIRNAFKEAGHDDWLITVATSINPQTLQMGYDMVGMAPHIDWFNMMAYGKMLVASCLKLSC
jgi:chitinase